MLKQLSLLFSTLLLTGSVLAAEWVPVTGRWINSDGILAEYSDSVAKDGQPLWAVAGKGSPNRLSVNLRTRDGAGAVLLALRWQNSGNYYALRYSDPHRKLEILKRVNRRETILASRENAATDSPQKKPLLLTFEVRGSDLIAKAGSTELTAHAENFASGAAALGCAFRQVEFRSIDLSATPSKAKTKIAVLPRLPRTVILRNEAAFPLRFELENKMTAPLKNAVFTLLPAPGLPAERKTIAELVPNQTVALNFPFAGNRLRSGDYRAVYRLEQNGETLASGELDFIVAEPLRSDRFEVILWDMIHSGKELAHRGFTASSVSFFNTAKYTENPAHLRELETALRGAAEKLKYGIATLVKVDTRRYWNKQRHAPLLMPGTDGKPQLHGEMCPNHPQYRKMVENALHAFGKTFAGAPHLRYLLFDSESENEERKLYPCEHPECVAAMEKAGYRNVPKHLLRTWGMVGVSLGGIAKKSGDHILRGGTPELDFIKWWWLNGSGFVRNRAEDAAILKRYLPEARTFHDPILRNPPFLGRDRGMDFVSQWTYANPSPLALLENIDEMRGATAKPQEVVPNIQLFHYSSEVVGKAEKNDREAGAFVEARDAVHSGRFVTIAPDLLREAVWLSMSRPVKALMLDGGSAISDLPGTYANTNPDTAEVLTELSQTLIVPYGPMLKLMTGAPHRVAVLQSAASTLYGRTGNYGNADKTFADAYNSLLLAQIQPEILYDETLNRLSDYEVFVVTDTNYLRENDYNLIRRFSETPGKLLLVDRRTPLDFPRAVRVDFPDTAKLSASARQSAWVNAGKAIKNLLISKEFRYTFQSPSDSVILSRRIGNGDQALFAVNDLRKAGIDLGRYGKLLDEGVPQTVFLTFPAELMRNGRVIYDVAARRPVAANPYEIYLPAGGGKWFYAASAPITGLSLKLPERGTPGKTVAIEAELRTTGRLDGSQAVRLMIRDSAGRTNTASGCYAARNGKLRVELRLAENDRPGFWQVSVEDLIAGHRAEGSFEVVQGK